MSKSFSPKRPRTKYPLATVMPYGPNDKTVTKLVIAIFPNGETMAESDLKRWVGTNVAADEKVARQMYEFMRSHGVKTISTATVVMGCPHEEGEDFPKGEDCPFCPFWKDFQGSGSPNDGRWDNLKYVRVERLDLSYRFWLPD